MTQRPAGCGEKVRICPDCQSDLIFVAEWSFRGLWGYNEVHTYECATHGPIFIIQQIPNAGGAIPTPNASPDDGDRESLITARRSPTPTPTLNPAAIALREPDSE
jgi:hypothetical protein